MRLVNEKILDIIIPIYDTKREYLSRALNSIVNQKNVNLSEIGVIVVDDYSQKIKYKDTWFVNNFPKLNIEFVKNQSNVGPGISRQNAIDNSYAEYITFLDSDDEFYKNSLEKVIYCLKREKINRIYTAFYEETIDQNNKIQLIKHDFTLQCLRGCFLKRDFLKQYNIRFSDKLRYYEDTYFTNIISTILGNSGYLDEISYVWKYNPSSMVGLNDNNNYNHLEEKILSIIESHNFLSSIKMDKFELLINDFIYLSICNTCFKFFRIWRQ